jgi:hypothetical protein
MEKVGDRDRRGATHPSAWRYFDGCWRQATSYCDWAAVLLALLDPDPFPA